MAVAENWRVVPLAMVGSAGNNEIDASSEEVTTVEPAMFWKLAVMVEEPGAMAETRPWSFTVATPGFAESQVTKAVMFDRVLFE